MQVRVQVNGTVHQVDVASDDTLLTVLRDVLDLTGTKYGCGEDQCGACTVLADGQAIKSCQAKPVQYQGRVMTKIEGLARGDRLHQIQKALLEHETHQYGFFTPAMKMLAAVLL